MRKVVRVHVGKNVFREIKQPRATAAEQYPLAQCCFIIPHLPE